MLKSQIKHFKKLNFTTFNKSSSPAQIIQNKSSQKEEIIKLVDSSAKSLFLTDIIRTLWVF